jgi:hypothetical protein
VSFFVMDFDALDERVNGYRDPRDGLQYPGWAGCRVPGAGCRADGRTGILILADYDVLDERRAGCRPLVMAGLPGCWGS